MTALRSTKIRNRIGDRPLALVATGIVLFVVTVIVWVACRSHSDFVEAWFPNLGAGLVEGGIVAVAVAWLISAMRRRERQPLLAMRLERALVPLLRVIARDHFDLRKTTMPLPHTVDRKAFGLDVATALSWWRDELAARPSRYPAGDEAAEQREWQRIEAAAEAFAETRTNLEEVLRLHYEDVDSDLRRALVNVSTRGPLSEQALAGKIGGRNAPTNGTPATRYPNVTVYMSGMAADLEAVVSAFTTWADSKATIPNEVLAWVDYISRPTPGGANNWHYEQMHPSAPTS